MTFVEWLETVSPFSPLETLTLTKGAAEALPPERKTAEYYSLIETNNNRMHGLPC
jgi:hypothetical protein